MASAGDTSRFDGKSVQEQSAMAAYELDNHWHGSATQRVGYIQKDEMAAIVEYCQRFLVFPPAKLSRHQKLYIRKHFQLPDAFAGSMKDESK